MREAVRAANATGGNVLITFAASVNGSVIELNTPGDDDNAAAGDLDFTIGQITHPSPAKPRANRGWAAFIKEEFRQMGVTL